VAAGEQAVAAALVVEGRAAAVRAEEPGEAPAARAAEELAVAGVKVEAPVEVPAEAPAEAESPAAVPAEEAQAVGHLLGVPTRTTTTIR